VTSRSSYVTVTDQFCGAGGSSIGATSAGAELRLALNHWKLAIETHNSNFPDADHDCTDISACDPRRYPSTDILLTSPECTNHSLAKGKVRKMQAQLELFGKLELDPAEERSRATMWDVCRFAEHHHYRIVIVENVVEARWWTPFPAWLQAMELLGYHHKIVYLNSMFAHPTPQSRDRMYVVFWKKSLRAPNLDIRPRAHCPGCGRDVASVQSWKNPTKPWGKYGQQYVYRCPDCAEQVTPYYFCAANAIDWSLPAPRIGDRARPLKEKTLKRIEIGLKKFARPIQVDLTQQEGRARPLTDPAFTQVGSEKFALAVPPFLVNFVQSGSDGSRASSVEGAWPTQVGNVHHALITPPFTIETQWSHAEGDRSAGIEEPLPTQTGQQGRGVVVPPFLVSVNHSTDRSRDVTEAAPTAMPQGNPYLVTPPYLVDLRGENAPKGTDDPLSTVCGSGNHHGLVMPFLSSYYGTGEGSPIDDPVPTVPTRDRHALVLAPFIVSYYTRLSGQQAAVSSLEAAVPTVPGRATHYLAQPGETPAVEDCGFRMLQPHEIGRAMAFPNSYKVLGNQREKVKQFGNAVTPPVMEVLLRRCLEVLG
jgi:DNA (cytosine-5)-methyltransferase 1